MDQSPKRVVMIDDQISFVDAFGLALSLTEDLKLVARASDAPSGLDHCLEYRPDLVISDYRLPDGRTGTNLATSLREQGVAVPIVILTGFLAPQVRREVSSIPAVSAISKDASVQEIVTHLRLRLAGIDPESSQTIDLDSGAGLSAGELEVLEALNTGAAPNEIAEMLHLSVHTVRGRIKSIYRKLSVGSLGDAIATATRMGVLVPPT